MTSLSELAGKSGSTASRVQSEMKTVTDVVAPPAPKRKSKKLGG